MNAIVMAGGTPQPGEPLYEYTQGKIKALLEMSGKPMIQWVIDALCSAASIDHITIAGLTAEAGITCSKGIDYIPNQGDMLENIRAGMYQVLKDSPQAQHVLLVSSDIPGVTSEMVDWVVNTSMQTDDDIYYNVIPRPVMEGTFPDSRRTYTKLKGMEICGGDMNMAKTSMVTGNDELWNKLIAARKNVIKQAALIGYDTLFLLLFRLVTVDQTARIVSKRLKIKGRVLICPYAEVGMDVDKPHQLEIMRAFLAKRTAT